MMPAWIAAAMLVANSPSPAGGTEPSRTVAPADTKRAATDTASEQPGARSSGGTDRGGLEFALSGATAAVVVTMVTLGIRELVIAQQLANYCARYDGWDEPSECWLDPPNVKRTAAGLKLGLAVPLSAASALLLRQAVRINRDYRAFHAAQSTQLGLWYDGSRSGGITLQLRF